MKKIITISSMLIALVMGMLIITSCGKAKDVEIANFDQPEKNEKIAVISVEGFGDIKVKLFPEYAPKGVENFITHAENGYYDELNFHRVINNFMIQGGDPKGNGTGGESIWGTPFEVESVDELRNFKGALCYANRAGQNTSQFYIVSANADELTDEYFKQIEDSQDIKFPTNIKEKYKEVGGTPFLDGNYTVFGQVIDGLDVVDAISKVETTYNQDGSEMSKPIDYVKISTIKIIPYEG
ncbi:MAG: peptidylprolyl isomerase [Clostridiales bacterium]|nr:peptidylprolyl isomerase [Clostridiales bacterium]